MQTVHCRTPGNLICINYHVDGPPSIVQDGSSASSELGVDLEA